MDNQKATSGPTIRFNLALSQPTDDHYNEFSYAKLVSDAVKKKQEQKPLDGTSEDQKLADLAKKFEEKYGPKNKRLIRDQDYMDIGYGYDSEDSFVDDSEAYDEFVPHSLDTKHGGFYINTGDLEFKDSEEIDPDEMDFKPKKVPIKKQLSGTPQAILASKKVKLAKQHIERRKALLQNPQATASLKTKIVRKSVPLEKSKLLHAKSAEEITPVEKIGSNIMSGTQIFSSLLTSTTSSVLDLQSSLLGTAPTSETSNSTLTPTMTPSDRLLQHVLTGSLSKKAEKLGAKSLTPPKGNVQSGEPVVLVAPKAKPVLPDGLPDILLSKITLLEMIIMKNSGDSKPNNKTRNQYDGHLIEIDHLAKQLALKMRAAVFEYVAHILGVSKQTLTGKIKKAIRRKEEAKIKVGMDALKNAIDARMPALLSKYEESIKALGLTAANTSQDSLLKANEDDSISDLVIDLSKESNGTTSASAEHDNNKPRRVRKTFHWDDEMRSLLHDVVKRKINAELAVQKKVSNWEEILTDFIDNEVKSLWPKGWMQKSVLLKICEPICKPFTSQQDGKSAGGGTVSTAAAAKKVVKTQKDVTVKKEIPIKQPPIDIKPVPAIIHSKAAGTTTPATLTPASQAKLIPPRTSVVKLTPSMLQATPSVTSSISHLASSGIMQPFLMNFSNPQLGKTPALALPRPVMCLTTGDGSRLHSSSLAMSLAPSIILPTTSILQKHGGGSSQWQQSSSSNVATNLSPTPVVPKMIIKTSQLTTTSTTNPHTVLQEHSYQKGGINSSVSNSLPASSGNSLPGNQQVFSKLFISPTNPSYK